MAGTGNRGSGSAGASRLGELLVRESMISVNQLRKAQDELKTLTGILPICSNCKDIRNDRGAWLQLEEYISTHSEAEFSHGVSPDCLKKLYPDLPLFKEKSAALDKGNKPILIALVFPLAGIGLGVAAARATVRARKFGRSELELHTIRARLTAGILSKAERGELGLTLPTGLIRTDGVVIKHPSVEVQDRIDLIFAT